MNLEIVPILSQIESINIEKDATYTHKRYCQLQRVKYDFLTYSQFNLKLKYNYKFSYIALCIHVCDQTKILLLIKKIISK